jgi:hypothetical protein
MKGRGIFHKVRLLIDVMGMSALVVVVAIWVSKINLSEAQPPPQAGQEVKVVDENGVVVFGANSAKVEVTNPVGSVTVEDESGNTVFGGNPAQVEVTNFPATPSGGGTVFTLFGRDFCPAGSTLVLIGEATYLSNSNNQPGGAFCNVGDLSIPSGQLFERLVVMGDCVICKF